MSAGDSIPLQPQDEAYQGHRGEFQGESSRGRGKSHVREESFHQGNPEGSNAILAYEWYLDTGCSHHMCGIRRLFSSLNETLDGEVSCADGTKIPIKGRGEVKIRTREGNDLIITDVLFLPDLQWNLLSAGQLSEEGYSVLIKEKVCTIQDSTSRVVATIPMTQNRMFPLGVKNDDGQDSDVVEIVEPEKEHVIIEIEDSDDNVPDTTLPSSSSGPSTSRRPKRRRTVPTRFQDFVIPDDDDSDEDLTNARLVNFCQIVS